MVDVKKNRIEPVGVYDKSKTLHEKRAYYEQLMNDVSAKEQDIKNAEEELERAKQAYAKALEIEQAYAERVEQSMDAKEKKVLKKMEESKIMSRISAGDDVNAKLKALTDAKNELVVLQNDADAYADGLAYFEDDDKPLSQTARVNVSAVSGKTRVMPVAVNNGPGDDNPINSVNDIPTPDNTTGADITDTDDDTVDSSPNDAEADDADDSVEDDMQGEDDEVDDIETDEEDAIMLSSDGEYFNQYPLTENDKKQIEEFAKNPEDSSVWKKAQSYAEKSDSDSELDKLNGELKANKKAVEAFTRGLGDKQRDIDVTLEAINTEFNNEEKRHWLSKSRPEDPSPEDSAEVSAAIVDLQESYDIIDDYASEINDVKKSMHNSNKIIAMFEARNKVLEERIAELNAEKSESLDEKFSEAEDDDIVSADGGNKKETKDDVKKTRKISGKVDTEKESQKMSDTKSKDELINAFDNSIDSDEKTSFKQKMKTVGKAIGVGAVASYAAFKDKVAIPAKNKAVEIGKSISYGYSYYKEMDLRFKAERQVNAFEKLSNKNRNLNPEDVVRETLEARNLKTAVSEAETAGSKTSFKEKMGNFAKNCGVKLSAARDWAAERLIEKGKSLRVGYSAFKEQKSAFNLANTQARIEKCASREMIPADAVTLTEKMIKCDEAASNGKENLDTYIAGIKSLLDSYDASEKTDADKKMVFDNLEAAVSGARKMRELPDVATEMESSENEVAY